MSARTVVRTLSPFKFLLSAQLLQAVYDDLTSDPKVLDITVEDPSDEFTALRDFVDCRNGLRLDCLCPPRVHEEFNEETQRECRDRLKLNKVGAWQGVWLAAMVGV